MSEYNKAAYERTGVATLQRIVLDRFMRSDSPAKETVTCEEVFVADSEMPQEAWVDLFEKLAIWENDARTRMAEFKWTKDRPSLPFLSKKGTEKKDGEAKQKKTRRGRKPAAGGEGSGSEG